MAGEKDTVIVVGKTEVDGWGNLWVIPKDGGDRVKIAKKREHLHELFEQGKAVLLHWEVYMDKPYVANAELVTGNLPEPTKPIEPPLHPDEPKPEELHKYAPQEIGMWWKSLGDRVGDSSLEKDYPKSHVKIKGQYYKKMSEVTGVDFKS